MLPSKTSSAFLIQSKDNPYINVLLAIFSHKSDGGH